MYKEIIKKMTLEEKASLLSGKDFWQTRDIKKLGIPSAFCADGPHGVRRQKAAADHLGLNPSLNSTAFPTAPAMANTFNPDLIEELGRALGKEANSQKVNILLGPGVNIKRSPLCGRNFEYFSEDPYLAGKIASAHIRGVQSNGISACAKHFAANNQEYRRLVSNSLVDERALREIYLTPFEMAVKEGNVRSIMASYNRLNGTYTNENDYLLNDVLRKTWHYDGIVISDWGGNNDRLSALKANAELEMPFTAGETNNEIVQAVKAGLIDESLLDENLNRLLTIIFETNKALTIDSFDQEAHHDLAQRVAEEGAVLLKNNCLPLQNETFCFIGSFADVPRYQGAGSSLVNPTKLDKAIDITHPNYKGYEPGFKRYGKSSKKLIKRAIKLAKQVDVVVVFVGLDEATEAEGMDRKNMKIPQNQIELINALKPLGKKIVAVLSCGSAVELDFVDDVDALLHGYLAGQAGMKAIINIMLGKVNPSGKLSESYPYKLEDTPITQFGVIDVEYRESIFVGYRYYDKIQPVRFPFGFGLSYTTFEYSDLKVTNMGVSFKIKNTGKYDGYEVAQLYVGKQDSRIFRPKKELKGFKKVYIKMGETVDVTIPFDEYTFRYFDVNTKQFEIEDGIYQLYVGQSVNEIKLIGEIKKDGISNQPYHLDVLKHYYSGNVKEVTKEEFEQLYGEIPQVEESRVVTRLTTVADLRKAKGWTGRLFNRAIRFVMWFLKKIGNRQLANTLNMGVYNTPLRSVSRMSGGMISMAQLDGLIVMFNGKFFKGLRMFFKAGKAKKKFIKQEKERIKNTEIIS